jgi:endonuclease YncB( thermonuclease family)
VELENGAEDTDDAGRLLRYVYVDGEMINLVMVNAGYAVVARFPTDFTRKSSFVAAQDAARQDRQGYWRETGVQAVVDEVRATSSPTPAPAQPFSGGTLPLRQNFRGAAACDYSGTSEPVIKGNVDARTGERIYLVPGSLFYSTTEVNNSDGDTWFCTEAQAIAAGWAKAKH